MSNDERNFTGALVAGLACVALNLAAGSAFAETCPVSDPVQAVFDPCPGEGDFALPLPGGTKIVFRRIEVPGNEFWGSEKRIIRTGDPQGGIFQQPQRAMIGGAFPGQGNWYYFIGKYEISKGQVAAILGGGDMAKGVEAYSNLSGASEDRELTKLSGVSLDRALAYPAAWLSWTAVNDVIDRLNKLCFADTTCRKALPRLDGKGNDGLEGIGFARLPTEVEWEYAARSSGGAANFDDPLPFPRNDWGKYAYAKPNAKAKPRRIGTLNPLDGLHDMFGNVQEYTLDPFQAEMGQGKTGGRVARGGSFLDMNTSLRSSNRIEIGLYQAHGDEIVEVQSPTTGFRLVLSSVVLPSLAFRDRLEKEHQTYITAIRANTPAGQSLLNAGARAGSSLNSASASIGALNAMVKSDPNAARELALLQSNLEKAARELSERNQEVCDRNLEEGVMFGALFARAIRDAERREFLAGLREKAPNPTPQALAEIAGIKNSAVTLRSHGALYFEKYQARVDDLIGCGEKQAKASVGTFEKKIAAGKVTKGEAVLKEIFVKNLSEGVLKGEEGVARQRAIIDELKAREVYLQM